MKDYEGILWDEIPIIALDTETTGFSSEDRIVEIGMVMLEGEEVIDRYQTLVNPGFSIPEGASEVNGITDDMLGDAPPFSAIVDDVVDWLRRGAPIVAHNASFDFRMLSYDIDTSGWPIQIPTLCTMKEARQRGFRRARLLDVAENYGIAQLDAHRAEDDARVCGLIARKLTKGRMISECYTKASEMWIH